MDFDPLNFKEWTSLNEIQRRTLVDLYAETTKSILKVGEDQHNVRISNFEKYANHLAGVEHKADHTTIIGKNSTVILL